MLFDPARHEPLRPIAWDEERARALVTRIVSDVEAHFTPDRFWPMHPLDVDGDDAAPAYPLYHGAAGVIWGLHHLDALDAGPLQRSYAGCMATLLRRNARWLASIGCRFNASYLMGETGIHLLDRALNPKAETSDRLATLIEANLDNPTRELMWGAPGTMLAASFMHERTGEARWARLFRTTAARLRGHLQWSSEYRCHYWTQDMYGEHGTYLDAIHGFVATASVLIRGRHLLAGDEWSAWQECIATTIRSSATCDGPLANWRAWLRTPPGRQPVFLMQFCHGAPGFVVCLADMPGASLDDLLLAAGEAVWAAGPLAKGSNLCHGTGGNGYAFLKLYGRTHDPRWLDRARAFAMHAIGQTEAHETRYGRLRYSLWTGDLGFAIYLMDCIRGSARFPTLDTFFANPAPRRTLPAPAL